MIVGATIMFHFVDSTRRMCVFYSTQIDLGGHDWIAVAV